MIVKIGEKYYNSEIEPIMLILSDDDKENINNMHQDANRYCSYPDNMEEKEVESFMQVQIPREAIKFKPVGNGPATK